MKYTQTMQLSDDSFARIKIRNCSVAAFDTLDEKPNDPAIFSQIPQKLWADIVAIYP